MFVLLGKHAMACGINLYHCSIVKLLSCVRIADLKGEFKNVGLDFTKWNKSVIFASCS